MIYLFFQIWVWLVAAFALGWFAHRLVSNRGDSKALNSDNDEEVSSSPSGTKDPKIDFEKLMDQEQSEIKASLSSKTE
jgi:hypothetical protein